MLVLDAVSLALKSTILIRPFSLTVGPGEVVTIMGASGSGKSSLLSWVGGDLDEAFTGHGDVLLNGASISALPPEQRRMGRLFQDDLLFPHMTVQENLLFAVPRMTRQERLAQVSLALQEADMVGFEARAPHTLSGGQRQRVALMRALLAKPSAVLLDEPFSKLDASLRAHMRDHAFAHIKARGIPALLVTHDRTDAPKGGRVLMLANGEVRDV